MRKLLLLCLGGLFVLALGVYAKSDYAARSEEEKPTATPDPRRVIWMGELEKFIATSDSHSEPTFDTLTEKDCEKMHRDYAAALKVKNSDADGLAYAAAYCDLAPDMGIDGALVVFEKYHFEKQNWVKQGSALEWWNWKWRAQKDKKKHKILSATLDVEFRNDTVKRVTLDLTSPEKTLRYKNGSLDNK